MVKREIEKNEIIEKYKNGEEDFTRKRAITFSLLIVMIIRGHKLSIQNTINKVFASKEKILKIVSSSAYSQARRKLKAEVFLHLNEVAVKGYYKEYGKEKEVKLWKKRRLLGVDGTYLNVPDNKETRKEFTVHTNQYKAKERVQALASILYDLRNDIAINASIGKVQAEKNFLFDSHIEKCKKGDVIVLDRGYADYVVMAMLLGNKLDFCIRLSRNGAGTVREFWESDKEEEILVLRITEKNKKTIEKKNLAKEIKVRCIKVVLENGEIEVLATSLLDSKEYPTEEFKQVYRWRWRQETYYDRVKNIFEIERFSGQSLLTIRQDFYGVIFLTTLESILTKPVQENFSAKSANCKNPILVNRCVSYVSLIDNVVELLVDKHSNVSDTLTKLELLFSSNPTRHRSGRTFERNTSRNFPAKLFFYKYVKRIFS